MRPPDLRGTGLMGRNLCFAVTNNLAGKSLPFAGAAPGANSSDAAYFDFEWFFARPFSKLMPV